MIVKETRFFACAVSVPVHRSFLAPVHDVSYVTFESHFVRAVLEGFRGTKEEFFAVRHDWLC